MRMMQSQPVMVQEPTLTQQPPLVQQAMAGDQPMMMTQQPQFQQAQQSPYQQTQYPAYQQTHQQISMQPVSSPDWEREVQRDRLQMGNHIPADVLENPVTNEEVYQTSIKALIQKNLGFYVVATFLVGTQSPVSWEGILYSVGNDFVVLYQPDMDRYVTADLYSLKFMEFYNTKEAPSCAGCRRRDGQQMW